MCARIYDQERNPTSDLKCSRKIFLLWAALDAQRAFIWMLRGRHISLCHIAASGTHVGRFFYFGANRAIASDMCIHRKSIHRHGMNLLDSKQSCLNLVFSRRNLDEKYLFIVGAYIS